MHAIGLHGLPDRIGFCTPHSCSLQMKKSAQRVRLGLVALTLIIAAQPTHAGNEMPDAQGASNLTPVIQLDGTATREATINGTRVLLLGAGYETVFTGDTDPKKATARRLRIVYLVELHSKDPKELVAMSVRDLQVFADGAKIPLHGKAEAIMTSLKKYRPADALGARYAVPGKESDPSAYIIEQSLRLPTSEPEPELLNMLIDVQNWEGLGGMCWLKGVASNESTRYVELDAARPCASALTLGVEDGVAMRWCVGPSASANQQLCHPDPATAGRGSMGVVERPPKNRGFSRGAER